MQGTIRTYTAYTLNAFKEMATANVDKVTLEFGVKVAGEGRVPYITKGSGECNLKILWSVPFLIGRVEKFLLPPQQLTTSISAQHVVYLPGRSPLGLHSPGPLYPRRRNLQRPSPESSIAFAHDRHHAFFASPSDDLKVFPFLLCKLLKSFNFC
ncbi:CU044_2847 family protein [Acaryochloris marina]|uniref:CU044_2847 family protein n=1 Tax=Acaryochloris marina TaxID=155978 RepID=UPI001BAFA976|nr:CU044_2847 family protein [Acaryochloris marina]QUY46181.1 hypothetical protein I1H34_31145 [Acaryochloris marina S15]